MVPKFKGHYATSWDPCRDEIGAVPARAAPPVVLCHSTAITTTRDKQPERRHLSLGPQVQAADVTRVSTQEHGRRTNHLAASSTSCARTPSPSKGVKRSSTLATQFHRALIHNTEHTHEPPACWGVKRARPARTGNKEHTSNLL